MLRTLLISMMFFLLNPITAIAGNGSEDELDEHSAAPAPTGEATVVEVDEEEEPTVIRIFRERFGDQVKREATQPFDEVLEQVRRNHLLGDEEDGGDYWDGFESPALYRNTTLYLHAENSTLAQRYDLACALLEDPVYTETFLVHKSTTSHSDEVEEEDDDEVVILGHMLTYIAPILIATLTNDGQDEMDFMTLAELFLENCNADEASEILEKNRGIFRKHLRRHEQQRLNRLAFTLWPRALDEERRTVIAREALQEIRTAETFTSDVLAPLAVVVSPVCAAVHEEVDTVRIIERLHHLATQTDWAIEDSPQQSDLAAMIRSCLVSWSVDRIESHKDTVFQWFELDPVASIGFAKAYLANPESSPTDEDCERAILPLAERCTDIELRHFMLFWKQMIKSIRQLIPQHMGRLRRSFLDNNTFSIFTRQYFYYTVFRYVDLGHTPAFLGELEAMIHDRETAIPLRLNMAQALVRNRTYPSEDISTVRLVEETNPSFIRVAAMTGFLKQSEAKITGAVVEAVISVINSDCPMDDYVTEMAEQFFEHIDIPALTETQVRDLAKVILLFDDEDEGSREFYIHKLIANAAADVDAEAIADAANREAVLRNRDLYTAGEAVEDPDIVRSVGLSINKLKRTETPDGETPKAAFADCRRVLGEIDLEENGLTESERRQALQGLKNLEASKDTFREVLEDEDGGRPRTFTTRQIFHWVWTRIRNHDSRQELNRILVQQLVHFVSRCSRGHITGLIETLDSFDDDVKLKISYDRELFQAVKARFIKGIQARYEVALGEGDSEGDHDEETINQIDRLWEVLATPTAQRDGEALETLERFQETFSDLGNQIYIELRREYVPDIVSSAGEFAAAFEEAMEQFLTMAG